MVDHPDPEPASTPELGEGGMPDPTRRAFQSHAEIQLGEKVQQALEEIESVYERDSDAVVSCSGGKDSMATLALAAESDANHRAAHWDYGPSFIPRPVAKSLVENIRSYATPDTFFVCNESMRVYEPYSEATTFKRQLRTSDRIADWPSAKETGEKPIRRATSRLKRSFERDIIGWQLLGIRRDESGTRDQYASSLYGGSLGLPAAFPIREWSARDVWAYIVANDVPYPDYYDHVATGAGDGTPAEYEQVRMGGFFGGLVVDDTAVHGNVEWRHKHSMYRGDN